METKASPSFWWLKKGSVQPQEVEEEDNITSPSKIEIDISTSLQDFLEKEQKIDRESLTDADIGSIIEEINRVAAQSPLGPYERLGDERSVEEIMKEAERIFLESSKSFEQLSSRSKTSERSHNSRKSTPTPRSVSPLPLDNHQAKDSDDESYSEDFSKDSEAESVSLLHRPAEEKSDSVLVKENEGFDEEMVVLDVEGLENGGRDKSVKEVPAMEDSKNQDVTQMEEAVRALEVENQKLRADLKDMEILLRDTNTMLEQTRQSLNAKSMQSPEINLELEKTLEELKDTKEINTALQLQLDSSNKSYQMLKISYEELLSSNKILERQVAEIDITLSKYKTQLAAVQRNRDALQESEHNLGKLLETEKLQSKQLKIQHEKDAKCIQDLNRQIKEMERIITRKHPDSVSALIVAAKNDAADSNLTARKVLEERIKTLEAEAATRDSQSSKIFLEVQDKFNQMKLKYENHIEDLELHVADLKNQLKRKSDSYDVYTQTSFDEQKIPQKEQTSKAVQTDGKLNQNKQLVTSKKPDKVVEPREETHLLATIRGLQADVTNKDKTMAKLRKEIEELRNTNRKLQKEREGTLRSVTDRQISNYPERLALQSRQDSTADLSDRSLEDELRAVRAERDKMKLQLCRIEGDYQSLKAKRLQDLSALQEAHEREIATYLSNITPLREQLEVHQVSISSLQNQLSTAKEELAIVTVERDHLNNRLNSLESLKGFEVPVNGSGTPESDVVLLQRKIVHLEKRYEERENRIRAIVHGLAQKNITNRSCEQCAARQQQLIGYKAELDQLIATLRSLQ